MRIEIVDDAAGQITVSSFPPEADYVDLRADPRAVERIAAARQYLPLRNFLIAVNSAESIFATVTVITERTSSTAGATGDIHEFVSWIDLLFAVPSLNFDLNRYMELTAGLKELLDRESGDSLRGLLRICSCDFPEQNQRGYCLGIQLVGRGDSAKQAELRWGLGLARVQQALLFRARALGQQIGA